MTLEQFLDYVTPERREEWRTRAAQRGLDAAAVEDVVQETWRRLLRRHGIIHADHPDGYVWTTVTNTINDQLRKMQSEKKAGRVGYNQAQASAIPMPACDVEDDATPVAECEQLVRDAVESMTPLERQALSLFLQAGPTIAMAQMGERFINAMHRARVKMDDHLGTRKHIVLRVGLAHLLRLLDELLESDPGTAK